MNFRLPSMATVAVLAMAMAAEPAEAKEMYIRGSLGGAGSWAGGYMTTSSTYTSEIQTNEVEANSLGSGLSADASVGVELAAHLYGEVGIGYLYGLPFESKSTSTMLSTTETSTGKIQGQMFRITPALMITAGAGSLKPFARVGVVLAIPSVAASSDSTIGDTKMSEQSEYTGGASVGLTGAAGVEAAIGDGVAFAFEVNYLSMAYSPTYAKLTKSTADGVDMLPSMTTREKEIEFTDKRTTVSADKPSEGSPKQATSQSIPFSNIGAAVSLVYKF